MESKIRLLFQTNNSEYRRFYWFELKDRDFYWGSSEKTPAIIEKAALFTSDKNNITLKIPDNYEFTKKVSAKYSYHKDGKVHQKKTDKASANIYNTITKWNNIDEITEPKRFTAIISRQLRFYEAYNKKLDSGDTRAIVIRFGPQELENRFYFEFFICREGENVFPEPLLKLSDCEIQYIWQPLNADLFLCIRFVNILGLELWNPDKQIALIPNE